MGTLFNLSARLVLVYRMMVSTTTPKGRYKDSNVTFVRGLLWWTVVVAQRVNILSLLTDSGWLWDCTVGQGGEARANLGAVGRGLGNLGHGACVGGGLLGSGVWVWGAA